MPRVQYKNSVVQFPDGMTQEEMAQALKRMEPEEQEEPVEEGPSQETVIQEMLKESAEAHKVAMASMLDIAQTIMDRPQNRVRELKITRSPEPITGIAVIDKIDLIYDTRGEN
jgi:hypothetical protein